MKNIRTQRPNLLIIIIVVLAALSANGQIASAQGLTSREIARRSLPSVVLVIMGNSRDATGKTGSGFFVDQDIIATNLHVIKDCDEGVVKIVGQETLYKIVGIVGVDEKNDLALLKIANIRGKAMTLNSDDSSAIGDEVFAVGNPKGLEGTFSQGIVSSIRKSSGRELIQITAPISEGSSGGAVLNNRGEVIGVAIGAIEGGQSLNFAIPVSFLRSLVSKQKDVVALKSIKSNNVSKTAPNVIQHPKKISTIAASEEKCLNKFKKPLLEDDDLLENVRSIKEFVYVPKKRFDEWVLGEPVASRVQAYGSLGYIEGSQGAVFSGDDKLLRFVMYTNLGNEKGRPVFSKTFWFYDYAANRVTLEQYSKCPDCSSFELVNKIVIKCENDIERRFHADGKMFLKRFTKKEAAGKTTEFSYNGNGTVIDKIVIYRDKIGKVKEFWLNIHGSFELMSKRITTETKGQLIETETVCPFSSNGTCRILTIFDKNTNLILRKEDSRRILKYDYEFDTKGNWTKRTESIRVNKFGETYFEPDEIITREITYY